MKFINTITLAFVLTSCAHTYKVHELPPTPENIRMVLRDSAGKFKSCYQSGIEKARKTKAISGTVIMKFHVDTKGRVSKADVQSNDFKSQLAFDCMKIILTDTEFPHAKSSGGYDVTQPMNVLARVL